MKAMWQIALGLGTALGVVLATGAASYASPGGRAFSSAERDRAVAYWTAERMRSAAPLDLPAGGDVVAAPITPSGETATVAATPASFPNPGGPWVGGGGVARTVGRVFAVTPDNRDVYCTATAVTSSNRSTTMTAAHCVRYNGAFMAMWIFAPGYSQGNAPYGVWPARRIMAMANGGNSPNPVYDVGAGIVAPINGIYLTDAVGGQGITFNEQVLQDSYAFGYIVPAPYYGNWLAYCSGRTSNDGQGNPTLVCNMNTGAGGGPWLTRFSEATGSGLLNSVITARSTTSRLVGAYFGQGTRIFYDTAQFS